MGKIQMSSQTQLIEKPLNMWRYFPMIGEKINEAVEDLRSEEAVIESSWVPKPASVQTSCSD